MLSQMDLIPLTTLQATITGLVADKRTPDISLRQLGVFLTTYLVEPPPEGHTIRGLAKSHGISKPAVVRSVDRLSSLGMAVRSPDKLDRRSVRIHRTPAGTTYLRILSQIMKTAAKPEKLVKPVPKAA